MGKPFHESEEEEALRNGSLEGIILMGEVFDNVQGEIKVSISSS